MKTLALAALVLAASRPSSAGGFHAEAAGIPSGTAFAAQAPLQFAPGAPALSLLAALDARTAEQALWRQETASRFAQIPGATKAATFLEGRDATVTVEFQTRAALEAAKAGGLLPGSVKSPSGLEYAVVPVLRHPDAD